MKNAATILCMLLAVTVPSFAQIPVHSGSANPCEGSAVTMAVSPVVRKDGGTGTLVTAGFSKSTARWKYITEVSGVERFNTSGVVVASRGHHISLFQSVRRIVTSGHHNSTSLYVGFSGFLILDERTLENVTRQWDMEGRAKLKNGSTVSVQAIHRWDRIEESFSLGRMQIPADDHTLSLVTVTYAAPRGTRFMPFAELAAGTYYTGAPRYSVRAGERFTLTRTLSGMADLEYSLVNGEQPVTGIMTRLKIDWKINRLASTGLFLLNNSFKDFNGLLVYAEVSKRKHTLRVEYREMRDQWAWVESTHPFFASHVLVQYTFGL